ncbi:MAG: DUF2281 domain-containing protein [Gemmatimonadetes bacterium]|nr:DUF2281 domain-containing protein [Gemmatimonadota bacterium]
MNDITRERLWRKLQVLPDEQLYQVLDYIEFLESKYAKGKAPEPTGLQRFAERLEDRLRMRSIAPQYIRGAVGLFGTARKVMEAGREVVGGVVEAGLGVVDGVVETGKELLSGDASRQSTAAAPLPPAVPDPAAPSAGAPPSASPRAMPDPDAPPPPTDSTRSGPATPDVAGE